MTWLSTKKTAELLGYEESTIRKKVKNGEYKFRYIPSSTGRGGKKMEILLESLPEQAQQAYHNQINGASNFVFNTNYTSTKAQKIKDELRALAVSEYRKYEKKSMKEGMTRKIDIRKAFVKNWNKEHPDFQITSKSLYDWQKKSKTGQVEKLIDKRGGYNRGQSKISEKYKQMFNSLYLQQTKPSLQSCYDEIKLEAMLNGDYLPGIKAFRNYKDNLDKALVTRFREGKKVFDDTCMPYIERDYSLLAPNDYWVSDHHLWDIFVRVPDGKGGWKLERPWGSYWMDMRTRKMMSSIIRTDPPNSDVVLCSFGLGCEHFGIPKGVRLDNGKDYKARDMFYPEGHYLSETDNSHIEKSLAFNLDIAVTYAIPYNAKAKPIERVFNTFEEQLGKKYSSYAGSNAKKRPEDLKDLNIMNVITLEEFIEHHNKYVYEIYNEKKHSGNSMYNKSPNQLYSELDFTLRKASKEVMYFSLMRVKGVRVIGRNGVTFNKTHFYNDNCINYIGEKVLAKYDPTKPEILYIFDSNENFLFVAEEVEKQGWDLTNEDYHKENHKKKVAHQKTLNSYTTDNVVRSTKAIGERLQRQADSLEKADIANPKTIEIVRNERIEENFRKVSLNDIERNYENVLENEKKRKKEVNELQKAYGDKFKTKYINRARETRKDSIKYEEAKDSTHTNFG